MNATAYSYDSNFHRFAANVSRHAAEKITPILLSSFSINSVLDVGCALGTWLNVWRQNGVAEILGTDSEYVLLDNLEIDAARFQRRDLAREIHIDGDFDLVQCLEVAEHLPLTRAASFVGELVRKAPVVLFSAAPPGQGGEWHVNEQPYEYWRQLFAAHGYEPYDLVRPLIQSDKTIPFWYRYNVMVYVRESDAQPLHPFLRLFRVPDGAPIPDFSPPLFRLRKAVVRLLPFAACQVLAKINSNIKGR